MIRLANPEDAMAIAAVHVSSWQVGELDLFSENLSTESVLYEQQAAPWNRIISERPEDVAVFETQVGIVGFVSLCLSQDEGASLDTGELTGIYLDPKFWGKGIGKKLMQWAKSTACARSWQKMSLWVLSENQQARSFYESSGWTPDGGRKSEPFGDSEIVELRYTWVCDLSL